MLEGIQFAAEIRANFVFKCSGTHSGRKGIGEVRQGQALPYRFGISIIQRSGNAASECAFALISH
jgi:hypothetical protein